MRSTNKSFYHYTITPFNSDDNTFGDKEYYFTWKDIKEKYNISRQTIYRITKDPTKTKFKHLLEKTFIHHTITEHLDN
tara:strand:- start:583 stop:816 length:234 start_codon:yes stop_codon:yes gene_type:complete